MTALAIHDLTFGYGRTIAVRNVTLRVEPGDCYGFLGHNGAGKTTVMRLALGLLRPARGSVCICGIDALRDGRRARALVGAMIERPGFHLHASAHDNLRWLARLQGLPRALAGAEAGRVLELAGLAAVAVRRVGTFSLGMRQRLGIAAALLGRPRLLLLDEPASSLDPEGIAALRALLLTLTRDDGVAVLLSSHQLAELEGLCNRVGVLREGAMVVEGGIDELRRALPVRQVVAGTPLVAMERRLRELGLVPERAGDRLLVAMDGRPVGAVARELAAAGELTTFCPEPATLEAIYLRAHAAPPPATPFPAPAVAPAATPVDTAPRMGTANQAPWRAFGHELRVLLARRSTLFLLLVPVAAAVARVVSYRNQVAHSLARVQAGELFSADAGSGPLAFAMALQVAVPVLALVVTWVASQIVAAECAVDTLRNTAVRAVRRVDLWFGKLGAVLAFAVAGQLAVLLVAAIAAAAAMGWGDLEEVTRHGDRQALAPRAVVGPVVWQAVLHGVLPMLALAALGVFASAVARRPARALGLAVLFVLVPEVLRDRLGDGAGWLLTSHLPAGWRDDSVVGFFVASARGAADAFWRWRGFAVVVPLAWLAAAGAGALWLLRRMRIP
ncbi:MAG: ABC transporter ATP-binding protein [Planctomycetota bacterium]